MAFSEFVRFFTRLIAFVSIFDCCPKMQVGHVIVNDKRFPAASTAAPPTLSQHL
jgi:deoxycytidylate deaminase